MRDKICHQLSRHAITVPCPQLDTTSTTWSPLRRRKQAASFFNSFRKHDFKIAIGGAVPIQEGHRPFIPGLKMVILRLASIVGSSTSERHPHLYFNPDAAHIAIVQVHPD